MNSLWVLMILLACPLMMLLMMRGMGGMSSPRHGDGADHTPESSESAPVSDARIAQLEREIAELRSSRRGQTDTSRP